MLKAARGRGSLIGVLFGLAFGSFGSVFLVFFFPWRALDEIRLSAGGRETPGVIIAQHETNMSVNETKVMAHRFQFTAADGTRQEGECFTTGPRWDPGLAVAVRYLPGDPAIACIEGARLNKAGWWAGFVVIFPLVGFGIVAAVVLSRRSAARLLREGHATEVDVLAVDATSTQMNYQTVY
ncbi:MAG: DUF3592 domain-containing protein, partial [Opitutus sp.]